LPTDTMKNTVYALARQKGVLNIETFAQDLGRHFLGRVPKLRKVRIQIAETPWSRIGDHGAAFVQSGSERPTVAFTATSASENFVSGIQNLQIMKTGRSGFSGFMRDEFTTLPETADRLLGTVLEADWTYATPPADFDHSRAAIQTALLDSFAVHRSLSVQQTLHFMAEKAFERFEFLSEIHLTMPNKHCLLIDLSRFGMDNPNQVFVPIDEPSGYIEARYRR
jgi:urate oxidase